MIRTRIESKPIRPDSGLQQDYIAGCQQLKRENDAYRRIHRTLAEYESENELLKELPLSTMLAIVPMILVMSVALILLAMTRLPGIDSDIQSGWVVFMVYMTMVTIYIAVRFIFNAFKTFLSTNVDFQGSDVGIPSPHELDADYEDAMKDADLKYMPVSSDDPVDEFGYVRQSDSDR